MTKNWIQLEKRIGYSFKNKDLIKQALTHSSYAYESQEGSISDNEVLEFLGDSVLGLVVADYLVSAFPSLPEGELSKLRSAAASTTSLFHFAKKIKLDRYVLLGKGEEKSGGRRKKTILAGTFEAIIAALYLDGGLPKARDFLLDHLNSFYRKVNVEKFLINNYKSALQEYFQKENLPAPVYKTITTKGPDHRKQFTVEVFLNKRSLAKAIGGSKKEAEQNAAQKALKGLIGKKMKFFTSDTFLLRKKR